MNATSAHVLPFGTRCGIHGDPTHSGRCASCDHLAAKAQAMAAHPTAHTHSRTGARS